MIEGLKPLIDGGLINEATQQAINEAWETKLVEAREQMRAELREEFAGRYEHDKTLMVEALDKMVTESLSAEIAEFKEEKQALAEDRAKFNSRMVESASKFNNFLVTKLAEEIKELRHDRKNYESNVSKLEAFVMKALAEEIKEFDADKKAVVETKVRLVAGAKEKLAELQKNFVTRSAEMVKEVVTAKLETEMGQLKEDIRAARENMFGRRLFEAFAGEFAVTHLNENREIAKLRKAIAQKDALIAESKKVADEKTVLVESKEKEIRIIKESSERRDSMAKLLKPLNKEKAAIMSELLESVQTDKLQSAFDKYLPAVLNNSSPKPIAQNAKVLNESRSEVTGDKTAKTSTVDNKSIDNVVEIRRLAGLK